MIAKLSLAAAALMLTAGTALADGDCAWKMRMAKASTPAPEAAATPVDVATLLPPAVEAPAEPATVRPETPVAN